MSNALLGGDRRSNLTRICDEKNIPKLKAKTQKYEFNSSQNEI